MTILAKIVSYLGLLLTVVPSALLLANNQLPDRYKLLATIGMVLWFVTAPFWINKSSS